MLHAFDILSLYNFYGPLYVSKGHRITKGAVQVNLEPKKFESNKRLCLYSIYRNGTNSIHPFSITTKSTGFFELWDTRLKTPGVCAPREPTPK